MICQHCKTEQTEGLVENGKFICQVCFVERSKTQLAKKHKKNWKIITALKKYGIPGNRAVLYAKTHSHEFLERRLCLFEYRKRYGKGKVFSPVGWLQNAIEYPEKYRESEDFLRWYGKLKFK